MKKTTRRKFLTGATLLAAGSATRAMTMNAENQLVHHVFFWLKNPDSKEDLKKLIEGINSLRKIETLKLLKIGVPAATIKRDVIDDSYSVSELTFFDSIKDQDVYQDHPVHKKFVENYSSLWKKVVVYDSMDIQ